MKPKLLFALLLGWLTYGAANAQEQKGTADDICGTYYVESPVSDDAVKIQIYRATNGKYQGRFVWLSQPNNPDGTPRTDINNGEWVDGSIYDPTSGKTYGIKGKRIKGSRNMEMRYYWKRPVMGLNTTWKRL